MVIKKSEILIGDADRQIFNELVGFLDQELIGCFGVASPPSSCMVMVAALGRVASFPKNETLRIIEAIQALYGEVGWEVKVELPWEEKAKNAYLVFK